MGVQQQVQRMVPETTTVQVPQQTWEMVAVQVPRMVPQETVEMVPQTTTEMVATQVPRTVVQEVQTHTVPQVSYQQYQTMSQPMTMAAAPTTSYAAPITYGGYTGGSIIGGGITGGFTGGSIIGGGFGGRIY